MIVHPDAGSRRWAAVLLVALATAACGGQAGRAPAEEEMGWSVTAWGDIYEVFPETDALVAGRPSTAHVHVTMLADFQPLQAGSVEIVLTGPGGERVYRAEAPVRPGIFAVEVRPESAGDYDLAFRIAGEQGREEIRGGRVRVGEPGSPGRLLVAPAPPAADDGGEPLPFLKEEQWRSDFATAWVQRGSLATSVEGLAQIIAPAGGDVTLSAPVDAVLPPQRWLYPGRAVRRGEALFRLLPRLAAEHSLAELEARRSALETDLETSTARLARLEELLALEATSLRDVEEARARVRILESRRDAAVSDLATARAARQGGRAGAEEIRAPFDGEVAAVLVSPGAVVEAGRPLARVVRTDAIWLRVALPPDAVTKLSDGVGSVVLSVSQGDSLRLDEGVRLVSVAPQMDAATGTVAVLLEARPHPRLVLGTTVQAQILLSAARPGVVIPSSARVDDGGVPVVYLQLTGESFARQEIQVLERLGDRLLVDGLVPGQRLVTRGGDAVRRSSLLASGQSPGHVH